MSSQAENYTEFISLITNKVWRERIVNIVGQRELGILAEKVMNAYKTTPESVNPDKKDVFKAINLVPIDNVKVVIVGQDPFYGDRARGKADGLAFSTPHDFSHNINKSFLVFAKKLREEGYLITEEHGCLDQWAEQGVLLLNSFLTVRQGGPRSHEGWGWEKVTDAIIKIVNDNIVNDNIVNDNIVNDNCQEKQRNVVFLLCGGEAHKKALQIKSEYAKVYYAYHPVAESWQIDKLEKKGESLKLTDLDLDLNELIEEEKSQNEDVYVEGNKIVRNNTNKVFPDGVSNKSQPGYPKTPLNYTTYKSKYMPPNSDYKLWKDCVFHGAAYLKHAEKKLGIDVNFNLEI